MTLTIDFTPTEEARLLAVAQARGMQPSELAKQVLTQHLPLTVLPVMTPEERIRALDALAEQNRHLPVLSPDAFDRENLYEERC